MDYSIDLPGPWGALIAIATILFGAGGVWTFLAARSKSKAADKKADTADWNALMTFWKSELAKLDLRVRHLEEQHQNDEVYIERLEHHIWSQLPPPPPMRQTPPAKPNPPQE